MLYRQGSGYVVPQQKMQNLAKWHVGIKMSGSDGLCDEGAFDEGLHLLKEGK